MESRPGDAGHVLVELIDGSTGMPQRSWRFAGVSRLLIGRGEENDVIVGNPYVSRSHAYAEFTGGTWQIVAISSQQLVVDGCKVPSAEISDPLLVRLGANGSFLKFCVVEAAEAEDDTSQTLSFDPQTQPLLVLDREQLRREVNAIADADFFQRLTDNVSRLRQPRASELSPGNADTRVGLQPPP